MPSRGRIYLREWDLLHCVSVGRTGVSRERPVARSGGGGAPARASGSRRARPRGAAREYCDVRCDGGRLSRRLHAAPPADPGYGPGPRGEPAVPLRRPGRRRRLPRRRFATTSVCRRAAGAAAATINRETSALSRMFRLAIRSGRVTHRPVFPERLEENGPRQGLLRTHRGTKRSDDYLPPPYQDVLDFAYYSGWRKREILGLTWDEVDTAGERHSAVPGALEDPGRSRAADHAAHCGCPHPSASRASRTTIPRVFTRDGTTVRAWRRAWPEACQRAGVPGRLLHDCRRTTARNLVRAGVPERVAMLLTGHKTRAIFDRYCIVNEADLQQAGAQLVAHLEAYPDDEPRTSTALRHARWRLTVDASLIPTTRALAVPSTGPSGIGSTCRSYRAILASKTWFFVTQAIVATRSYERGLEAGFRLLAFADAHAEVLARHELDRHRRQLYLFVLDMPRPGSTTGTPTWTRGPPFGPTRISR